VIVLPAVNVNVDGTTAFGELGVLLAALDPVRRVPEPEEEMVEKGRVKTAVLADVAVLTTFR
jgi:hypothetical protein